MEILKRLLRPPAAPPSGDILTSPTLNGFLERLTRYEIPFETVIDVGASNGMWSRQVIRHFPQASYFLVEARQEHEVGLKEFVREFPQARYAITAAGDSEGTIQFHAGDLFGGLASHRPFSEHNIEVPVTRLDLLQERQQLKPPYFLKLDTHGFEEQIFAGAARVLDQSSLLVIEAYNHRMGHGNLLFHELIALLERRDFRCLDFFDPLYRPRDGSLWQADFAFARADWPGFQIPSYQ